MYKKALAYFDKCLKVAINRFELLLALCFYAAFSKIKIISNQ